MVMPGRNWTAATATGYRFGFNGQLKDDEIMGNTNSYDFGARIYNSRLGRWFTVDPMQQKYTSITPYSFGTNCPIIQIDPDGKDIVYANTETEIMLGELYKNGSETVKAKIDALKASTVIYNFNFYATEDEIKEATKTLSSGQAALGVTLYDFEESSKTNSDQVDVLVGKESNNTSGYDNRLIAINEIGSAYDFEIGNVGYGQGPDGTKFTLGNDASDEYGQAKDCIEYSETNLIKFPDTSPYIGLKNIINNTKDPTLQSNEAKINQAKLIFENGLGYVFDQYSTPSEDLKNKSANPIYKGSQYVYRQQETTTKDGTTTTTTTTKKGTI